MRVAIIRLCRYLTIAGVVGLLLLPRVALAADAVRLPFVHPLFQDHMVLQRGSVDPVWGWSTPGAKITVTFNGKIKTTTADTHGAWRVKIGPFLAGGPYTLTIAGPTTVTITDVLIGDVWLCAGQSNMEMGVNGVNNAQEEIAGANYPHLRFFHEPHSISYTPQRVPQGQWVCCTPQTVSDFTAAGYFFGREITRTEQVPVGLIEAAWGGTVAEAWTSVEALKTMPDFTQAIETQAQYAKNAALGKALYAKQLQNWYQQNDPGSAGGAKWAQVTFNADGWKTMQLPASWEIAGLPDYDGIVWFRREVTIPDAWAGKELTLSLGPIDDCDATFFNGERVGGMDNWTDIRQYQIPGKLVHAGKNLIAVRVLDTGGDGGIDGKTEQLHLGLTGTTTGLIALTGAWQYQAATPLANTTPLPQCPGDGPNQVSVLYNGMIAPLTPFALKGALWYQGEANAMRATQYRTLLPALIGDWRARFGAGDFPFLIVSLAGFTAAQQRPSEGGWAELREAQWLTTKRVRHTGIALAIDIGDEHNIHPKNKQEVGHRLAVIAENVAYGKNDEYSGPMYQRMQVEGKTIRLFFDHLGGGLIVKDGGKLAGFAIAGADKQFVWGNAVIDGDTIVVSAPEVTAPQVVRYSWASYPLGNLSNRFGLPAIPFRTDP